MCKLSEFSSFYAMPVDLYCLMLDFLPFKEIVQFGKLDRLFQSILDFYLKFNNYSHIVLCGDYKYIEKLLEKSTRLYA